MSAIKNPLFDVYFNRITALFALRFPPFMRTYLTSFALFAVRFLPVMRAYLTSFTLFAFRFSRVMRAYLRPFTLFAIRFLSVMSAYLSPFTLLTLIFVFLMFAKIFQIFRCSVFGHILNSVFHFYIKQKINSFCKIFQKTRIKNISKDSFEILFRVAVKYELSKVYFSTGISLK